jgi:hypothetical protein
VTRITLQDGKIVIREGKVGTEQECCCEKCAGPCDEENPCPAGCSCVDGECVQIPCDQCENECVMFLHGRTGVDGIFNPDGSFETWGVFGLGGFWGSAEAPPAQPDDRTDKGYALSVGNITCVAGEWVIAEIGGGGQVRAQASSFWEGLSGIQTLHNYTNVRVIVDELGCPSGLELGNFDIQQGPNGPSIHTPLTPDIVIDCNPFP